MGNENIESIVKAAVIAHAVDGSVADIDGEDIARYEACDYLTVNECRNGHIVVWYMDDDNHNACFDLNDLRFLELKEIEDQLC